MVRVVCVHRDVHESMQMSVCVHRRVHANEMSVCVQRSFSVQRSTSRLGFDESMQMSVCIHRDAYHMFMNVWLDDVDSIPPFHRSIG